MASSASKPSASNPSASRPLPLTSSLTHQLNAALKIPLSPSNHALQIVTLQARVWSADEEDQACRPWYILGLEIYPRGTVVNHAVHSPPSSRPKPSDLLSFLLKHITNPLDNERSIRPTHVSFVDDNVTNVVTEHLRNLKIKCETLTIADGVMTYLKKFSEKLVQRGLATRGDAAERPGMLSIKNVIPSTVSSLMSSAVQMFKAAPWSGIPEHVALQVRLPSFDINSTTCTSSTSSSNSPTASDTIASTSSSATTINSRTTKRYREKYYVTILGSDKKVFGFGLVSSLSILRDRYRRIMMKRTGTEIFDDENLDSDKAKPIASDVHLCASCGRRVGDDSSSEHIADRCSGCHRLLYCDENCQRTDWRENHKNECKQALSDPDFVFNRPQWAWLDRELAFLFLDPTSLPFDDLDAFEEHQWKFVDFVSPPMYAMPFVSVQGSDGVSSRRALPTEREFIIMNSVAQALTECLSTPPSDGTLHLSNGVSISLAENLADSIHVP